MNARHVIGAGLLAASLATLAGAQQGGGNPGNPGSQPPGSTNPNPQPGTPQTPAPTDTMTPGPQPFGSQPSGPAGPNAAQPGSGADIPGGPISPADPVDRGAPGQPGGAPSCPADNPSCIPNNPAAPTDTTRRQDGSAVPAGAQHRSGDTDGRLTSRVRESLLRGNAQGSLGGLSVSTAGGRVTLRGQVRSEAEKADLERRAAAIAGEGNVVNELTVAP
jgi:hypothetical protein